MRTTEPVYTPQQVIDLALDILTTDLGVSLAAVALSITDDCPITASTLSKVRSVSRSGNQYRAATSEGLTKGNKRERLMQALIVLLENAHGISFQDHLFTDGERQWGRIFADVPMFQTAKRQLPALDAITPTALKHNHIYDKFKGARRVRILHTYLTSIELFIQAATAAIAQGCTFQILLAEPNAELIRLRAKGLHDKEGEDVENRALSCYRKIAGLRKEHGDRAGFEFRTYNELPGVSFFMIDDDIYTCSQWYSRFSDDGPYLHTIPANPWAKEVLDNFDRIWASTNQPHWDITYNMYLLREKKLKKATLQINSSSFEARLTNTSSGHDYHGLIISGQNSCVNMVLHTKISDKPNDYDNRKLNFLIPIKREKFGMRALAISLYMAEFIDDKMLFNVVILENTNPTNIFRHSLKDEEKQDLAEAFLRSNPPGEYFSEVQLNTDIKTWNDVQRYLKKTES